MKWNQLKKGCDGIYRLDATEDGVSISRSPGSPSFSFLTFDDADERLLATDTRGNVYLFEFRCSSDITYKKLKKFVSPTCAAFNPLVRSEILLASTNNDVYICKFDPEHPDLTFNAKLSSHRLPILHITFYKHYCLTASSKEAIVWDLNTFSKAHQLGLRSTKARLTKATFSSSGLIAILYSNDALQTWSYQGFENESRVSLGDYGLRVVKDYTFTRDGRAIVVCAAKGGIRVLDAVQFEVVRSFQMPEGLSIPKKIFTIASPLDATASKVLAIHLADGELRFLDLGEESFVEPREGQYLGVRKLAVSPKGRWMACVEVDGSLGLRQADRMIFGKEEPLCVKKKASEGRPKSHRASEHLLSIKEEMRDELRLCRLLPILKEFGEYPERHRIVIWSNIMQLPMNREACAGLAENTAWGASVRDILAEYSLADQSKSSLLASTVDNLVKWTPLLGQCSFLPGLVFPFLIVFKKNRLLALEASITILSNFCQKWFEYHPLPPLNVLGIVENVLLEADPTLMNYFCEHGVTSSDYAWPLMRTTLSEVLTGNEWLVLWDHLLSYRRASFLLMCVVAYSICCRETIFALLKTPDDFRRFYSTQGNLSVKKLLRVARALDRTTLEHVHPDRYLRNDFVVLPSEGPYPPFLMHEYPKFLVEEQSGLAQLGALREEEKRLQERRLEAMKVAEEKRLRDEMENFVKDVQRNRMTELRKCYEEQLRLTRFNVENTRDELKRYASVIPEATSRSSESVRKTNSHRSSAMPRSSTRSLPATRTSRTSYNCDELRSQVQELESQVQKFIGNLRSRRSSDIS